MQNFNLGEIVRCNVNVDNMIKKPAEIIAVYTGEFHFEVRPDHLVSWATLTDFTEDDIKNAPVYVVEFPRPIRIFSFASFLEKYELDDTPSIRGLYEATVPSYPRASLSELFVELVAYSKEEWVETFESEEEMEIFLASYDYPV